MLASLDLRVFGSVQLQAVTEPREEIPSRMMKKVHRILATNPETMIEDGIGNEMCATVVVGRHRYIAYWIAR